MLYLTDAFTPEELEDAGLPVAPAKLSSVAKRLRNKEGWQSRIRHQSNADLISDLLKMKIEVNEEPLEISSLNTGDIIITFQSAEMTDMLTKKSYVIYSFYVAVMAEWILML